MTIQSLPYSTIRNSQPTTHKGFACDGVIDDRPFRILRNDKGGYRPAIGTVVPTTYGTGMVARTVGYNVIVDVCDYNDKEWCVFDGSGSREVVDLMDSSERVAFLSTCNNSSVKAKMDDLKRILTTETGKPTKECLERIEDMEGLLTNETEYVTKFYANWEPSDDTEILVEFISTPTESKAERKRRLAMERKEAKRLADRLLAEFGSDEIPDEIMGELNDAY
jgi:hypothetical protein